ncbi:MAG: Homoserine O-acetyltransferase [Candidatus Woesearchaeota archaeon]|nr:Homoserine O-acetyltransferase [Candidatus Woesearchaeota archaeon]
MTIKTGYKVMDAMTRKPVTVSSDLTIIECANLMKEKHVGSLIIAQNNQLKGILTEQDIVRKVVAGKLDPKKTKVSEIMVTDVMSIEPEIDIYEALVIMRDNNIRHLPVMFKNKITGYLTIKDILKIEPQLFELIVEKFELREEERKPVGPEY